MQSKAWLATNRMRRAVLADDLLGLGVGLPVRLEVAGLLHRDHVVERKADVRPGRLQHVAVAVGQDRELVAGAAQLLERRDHIGKRLQRLDLADEPAHLVLGVGDAAAIHDVGHGAVADLAVGRVAAVAQRVDHRVLEVRAPPPGDEAVGLALPALLLQEGRHGLGQALLHVDDGAVLVEHQRLDLALQDVAYGRHVFLRARQRRRNS